MTEAQEEYYAHIIERGGGMITCGNHLGVMVGPSIDGCPAGWGFIDIREATIGLIALVVDHVSRGRGAWPKNQKKKPKNETEMLDQVFDSQDYIG